MRYIILSVLFLTTIHIRSQELNEKNIGDKVEAFSAVDDQGNFWKSSEIQTNYLVVYFYPAAMTGGCTKQACSYRDNQASFDELDITVVGVSGDEVKNLNFFKEANNLNFSLLSDTKGNIAKALGVPIRKGGSITRMINGVNEELIRDITTPRWTFILDNNHTIIYKNASVNAVEDSKKVLETIKNYSK